MAKQPRILKWDVLSEAEWEARNSVNGLSDDAAEPSTQQRRLPLPHLWTALLVALLILGSGAYVVWRTAQAGLERIDTELALAVEADAWRAQPQPSQSRTEKIASNIAETSVRSTQAVPPKFKIDNVEIDQIVQDLAIVEVTTVDAAGNAYRQTQFYRELQDQGWQRVAPNVRFWGDEWQMETAHFRWHYRERDADAVAEVAPSIELAYLQLRRDVGLPPTSPDEKLTIEIQAAASNLPAPSFDENSLVIPSPLLLATPMHQSEVEVLHIRVLHLLVQHTLALAEEQQPVWCIWRPLLDGFVQWQVRAYGGSSSLLGVRRVHGSAYLMDLLHKDEDCLDRPVTQLSAKVGDPKNTALAATLFFYVAATYGEEGPPTLLAALRRYSTWDDAIPIAFGTSKETFEDGWRSYVMTGLTTKHD